MKTQKGFSLYIYIGALAVVAAMGGTIWYLNARVNEEEANVQVEKAFHQVFVGQVQHMTAQVEKDWAAMIKQAESQNETWGAKYNEQIAINVNLWNDFDRMRDSQGRRSERKTPNAPADASLVDCGRSESGFSAAFDEYRKRHFEAARQFGKEIRRIYISSGTRVRQEIGQSRDEALIRNRVIKGWAEKHPAFDHPEP